MSIKQIKKGNICQLILAKIFPKFVNYNLTNNEMNYISIDAMKLGIINTFQNNSGVITQTIDVLKELGINGFKLIIKNNSGLKKEELIKIASSTLLMWRK